MLTFLWGFDMMNSKKPEGQTTSDNFLKSEFDKDFLRAQSGWGEMSAEDLDYIDKKGFKTPADLLKSYRELERAFSSKISLPKDGDKKALDKLYSRLGMPQDCACFDVVFADEDKEDGEAFKQVCLENHILPQSAQAIYDWFVKHRDELIERNETSWAENSLREMEEMKRTWGTRAQRNWELMKRGVRMFCDDENTVAEIEKAIGTKRMMEVFCRLGEAISEDNPISFGRRRKGGEWNAVEYFREMFNDY